MPNLNKLLFWISRRFFLLVMNKNSRAITAKIIIIVIVAKLAESGIIILNRKSKFISLFVASRMVISTVCCKVVRRHYFALCIKCNANYLL